MFRLCSDSLLKWISVDLSGSHFLPWAHLGHIILYQIQPEIHVRTILGLCSDLVQTMLWLWQTKDPQILVETVFGPCQDSVKTPDIQCSDHVETVFGLPSEMDLSGSQWISFFTLSTPWLYYPIPNPAWDPLVSVITMFRPCLNFWCTVFRLRLDYVLTVFSLCLDSLWTVLRPLTYSVWTLFWNGSWCFSVDFGYYLGNTLANRSYT